MNKRRRKGNEQGSATQATNKEARRKQYRGRTCDQARSGRKNTRQRSAMKSSNHAAEVLSLSLSLSLSTTHTLQEGTHPVGCVLPAPHGVAAVEARHQPVIRHRIVCVGQQLPDVRNRLLLDGVLPRKHAIVRQRGQVGQRNVFLGIFPLPSEQGGQSMMAARTCGSV